MKTYGIRISDGDRFLETELIDILDTFISGEQFFWSILFIDGMPKQEYGEQAMQFIKKVNDSENGILIKWNHLYAIAKWFDQIYDLSLLSSKEEKKLYRYESDVEMIDSCENYIELFDTSCWFVYSKDKFLIQRFGKKFEKIKFYEDLAHISR